MRILIINLGALGAVVRTSTLLPLLAQKGEVAWLTKKINVDFLRSDNLTECFFIDEPDSFAEQHFDWVISLDEENEPLEALQTISYDRLTGAFLNEEGEIDYTPDAAYWFDMSMSSHFGKEVADQKKMANKKAVQEMYVEMIGETWQEQEYDLNLPFDESDTVPKRIGVIDVSSSLWQNKDWAYWDELKERLAKEGYSVVSLGERETIKEHIADIASCELVVCPDTFGMHIALALKKKVVALFTCTDPDEIYDYGRMKKIVSPRLNEFYYQKKRDEEAIRAITPSQVLSAIQDVLPREEKTRLASLDEKAS